ncbi:MAG: type I glyceraldehyde-3-phosphate dehydrogenase [Flavobacteriales bacterium]|nr:type I glyceraldehyde-3-phosphate dehydrogenase [Flavobacteriales bacterium]
MSKKKVAINGFGRIGRLTFRKLLENPDVEVVGINDLTDNSTLAHLLKYDSTQGAFPGEVSSDDNHLIVNGNKIAAFAERDPAKLPWGELNVDVVLESTGVFRDKEGTEKHLQAGAKRVILSVPGKGDIKMVVLGVNEKDITEDDKVISNASCTTNCLAPMAKVLHENFGIEYGYMTTIHAYTADQRIQDAPHSDLRRARAAALSMIPTTTGAAIAVSKVLPALKGKLDGAAVRVPTPTGSLTDLCVTLSKDASVEEVNQAMKKASEGELKGILQYTEDPIVSVDIIGNPYSCIFDSDLTAKVGNMLRIVGWYDNEAGYSARTAELIAMV